MELAALRKRRAGVRDVAWSSPPDTLGFEESHGSVFFIHLQSSLLCAALVWGQV